MTTLNIDKNGVPILYAEDIEVKAKEVISSFDPSILEHPQETPISDFIEKLHIEFNLIRDYTQNLGVTKYGSVILGKTQFKPLGIFIDISLKDNPLFNIVLGHEFGHVVLHKSVNLKQTGYEDQEQVETTRDSVTGKKILRTPRDWLEWQAGRFSRAILMPRATFQTALIEKQKEMGINRNQGHILLDNIGYSWRDYKDIKKYLMTLYYVNSASVKYRLEELGILIDQTYSNTKHISKIFTSE